MSLSLRAQRVATLSKKMQIAGDPTRLKILCYLFTHRRACVSEIAEVLDMHIAAVSHHLQALAHGGLLISDREGKRICYVPAPTELMVDLKKFICKYN